MSNEPTRADASPAAERRAEQAKAAAERRGQQQRRDAAPQGRRSPDREEA